MRIGLLLPCLAAICFAQTPAVDDLIRKLGHDDFDVRQMATRALVELGEQARPAVEAARKDSPDAEVRRACAGILKQLDDIVIRERLERLTKYPAPPPVPKFDPARLKPLVQKGGVLEKDEHWTADRSYHVTELLRIVDGVKLTIDPGVIVLFDERTRLVVAYGGSLTVAAGEDTPPTILTATGEKDGQQRPWSGVLVLGTATLANVEVRHSAGVVLEDRGASRSKLDRLAVYHTHGNGLMFSTCAGEAHDCIVQEASLAGVRISSYAGPTLRNCRVARCGTGVDVDWGAPTLENLTITDIAGDGVRLARTSSLRSCTVVRAERGVVLSGTSILQDVRVAAIRGNGFQLEKTGWPQLVNIEAIEVGGVGLSVQDTCVAFVGQTLFLQCKGGEQTVTEKARIQRIGGAEELP
jgi:hypothetical protein